MDLKIQGSTHGGRALESVIPLRVGPNRTVSLDQGQNLEEAYAAKEDNMW